MSCIFEQYKMAYVWHISVVNYKEKVQIRGVILEGLPSIKQGKLHSIRNFSSVIQSYFKKPLVNKKIILSIGNEEYTTNTDEHGGFFIELNQQLHGKINVFVEGKPEPIKIIQSYPIIFYDSKYPLNIISDVDDTILVSHTANIWKRVKTILFVIPQKRIPVSFTNEVLNKISENKGRVFFVSKSEQNLFGLLASFIEKNNIPKGILFLTPYLRFKQLLNPKKGKDYKEQVIKAIIDQSPGKKFILMGDDTQQDMAVYNRIVELYPDRIIKIYIRKTRKNLLENKKAQMKILSNSSVPFLYFDDAFSPAEEINLIENY